MNQAIFFTFGLLCLTAAIHLLYHRRAFYSALSLIVCLASLAVLYVQLAAPFAAVMQLIIYAGAIMILFVFVIQLLDTHSDERSGRPRYLSLLATLLGTGLFTGLWIFLREADNTKVAAGLSPDGKGSAAGAVEVGEVLFRQYLIPLEAVAILILMATLGAVLLAGKKKP